MRIKDRLGCIWMILCWKGHKISFTQKEALLFLAERFWWKWMIVGVLKAKRKEKHTGSVPSECNDFILSTSFFLGLNDWQNGRSAGRRMPFWEGVKPPPQFYSDGAQHRHPRHRNASVQLLIWFAFVWKSLCSPATVLLSRCSEPAPPHRRAKNRHPGELRF